MSNLVLMAIRRKRLPAACRTEVLELFDLAQTHSLLARRIQA